MAIDEPAPRKKGNARKAETYRGYRRNTTGAFEQARIYRRARWKALGLGERLAERRAAA
jgi:hypothetical protein